MTVDAAARADAFRVPIDGGYTQAVDARGTIEFAQREENALQSYQFGTGDGTLSAARDGSVGVTELDDEGLVVAYAPVTGTDWVVAVHAPQSEAYVLRQSVTRDFVILVGISLAGFALLGLTLGRSTVDALDRLTTNAEAIAAGDLDGEVESSERDDEVGELVDAFGQMQTYLTTVGDQAEALADQRFDAAVLDEDVPGTFGETMARMSHDVQAAQREMEALNEALEAKASEYGATMEQAADGNLTVRMDSRSESEAMVEIGDQFNEMMDEIEETVGRVHTFADAVAADSHEVTASIEEVQHASEQVAESVQEISTGAENQNDSLERVSGEMQTLSGTIEEVASSAAGVAVTADEAATAGRTGKASARNAIEEMNAIESQADTAIDEVESLSEEVEEIGEIVDVITSIAEQTNLLALNASIEAARAGGAGEGFGVVADEIKSLAEEAAAATDRIEGLIEEVQSSTEATADGMREMGERVTDGTETIEEALDALDEVAARVEEANDGMQEIDTATDDQAESTEEVVTMVEDVSGVAAQTSAEADTVSAAAEEQTSSLSAVTRRVQMLTERTDNLEELLAGFTVEATAPPDAATPGEQTGTLTRAGSESNETVDPVVDAAGDNVLASADGGSPNGE